MAVLEKVTFLEAFPHIETALNGYVWGACQECWLNQAQCYRAGDTYMMLRVESDTQELVVVALQGEMKSGTRAAIAHAKQLNLTSIRAHFFRRGAERFIRHQLGENARTVAVIQDNEHIVRIIF
ncbi:MAG: hypothetical protein ACK5MF_04140 [Vibrio sp.]|uniref:hypothetical protein n=1 Tax=Vibrio sp. TaxID=678 RepID=UPI003A8363A7